MLKLGPWNGTAIDAGEIWTLRKGSRVASCHLWTHPKGGEIRLTTASGAAAKHWPMAWRCWISQPNGGKQFEAKGWK